MSLILQVFYPDNEGETEYEVETVPEAMEIVHSVEAMPWTTPIPSWYLTGADGELISEGP